MFLYHDELDNGLILPVVHNHEINHEFDTEKMSNDFFSKYSMIFNLIDNFSNSIDNIIKNLNIIEPQNKLYLEVLKRNIIYLSKIEKTKVELMTISDIESYLLFWGEIIDCLYNLNIYKTDSNNFIKIMQLFNNSLIDIAYKRKKIKEYKLPNIWYITSNGYLYNAKSSFHEGSQFSYYYDEFKEKFINKKFNKENNDNNSKKINPFPELSNIKIIEDNDYVRFIILDSHLHYKDYIMFNKKSYDSKYLKVVIGMISIEQDFYNFLDRLNKLTNNPVEEFKKILKLTNDNYNDILIRCCGVSKITNSPDRTIVTSCIDYKYKFYEYIKKGWNISFIPPIIINESNGITEEYQESKKLKYDIK